MYLFIHNKCTFMYLYIINVHFKYYQQISFWFHGVAPIKTVLLGNKVTKMGKEELFERTKEEKT